jgi:hypothetical protein
VSWNCYRVSDCIVATDLERRLPLRSSVIADTSTNSAERVKADLKNIMLKGSCFLWFSMYIVRVEECLWSLIVDVEVQAMSLVTRVSAEAPPGYRSVVTRQYNMHLPEVTRFTTSSSLTSSLPNY